MARQNLTPPPWRPEMSDGGTGVPDKLIFSGSAKDVFERHDEDYHWGGGWWAKTKADFRMWWGLMRKPGSWKLISFPALFAVSTVGVKHWNWLGGGPPD